MNDDPIPTRDPAILYEAKESRTCAGCIHITTAKASGSVHQVCTREPGRSLEKKCRSYQPDGRAI